MRELLVETGRMPDFSRSMKKATVTTNLSAVFQAARRNGKLLSIELCPERPLNVSELEKLQPSFTSVTWHTKIDNPQNIAAVLLANQLSAHGYHVLLHLTGKNMRNHDVMNVLNEAKRIGVRNIFALQGDPCKNIGNTCETDFPYAVDLVRFIRKYFGDYFCVGVAGYPNYHPNSKSKTDDFKYFKEKVDAGADFVISQVVFDYESFNEFQRRCRQAEITVPIIPGLYIYSSYRSLINMTQFCKIKLPDSICRVVEENKNNPTALYNYGIHQAANSLRRLLKDNSVLGVHIFSLNDLNIVEKVCNRVGLYGSSIERPINVCDIENKYIKLYLYSFRLYPCVIPQQVQRRLRCRKWGLTRRGGDFL